jgi:hypothetical protein
MKRSFIFIIATALPAFFTGARGQSIRPAIVNATGGGGTVSGSYFDYSVGEMTLVSTFSGAGITVTQGLLQTNLFPNLGVPKPTLSHLAEVFPNPASDFVTLRYSSSLPGRLCYRLMDMGGRVVLEHRTDIYQGVTQEQICLTGIAAAPYLLAVSFSTPGGGSETASFKIDKLK